MPRGRPKGSKNKTQVAQNNDGVTRNDADTNVKIVGLPNAKRSQTQCNVNPDWVLTETLRGTPVAIEAICKSASGSTDYYFLVIPNYKTNTQKTIIAATSLIKPETLTDEQAAMLKDVVFGSNEDALVSEEPVGEEPIANENELANNVTDSNNEDTLVDSATESNPET